MSEPTRYYILSYGEYSDYTVDLVTSDLPVDTALAMVDWLHCFSGPVAVLAVLEGPIVKGEKRFEPLCDFVSKMRSWTIGELEDADYGKLLAEVQK